MASTFNVKYVFDFVVKNLGSLSGVGSAAKKMAGDLLSAGSAADKMASSASRVAGSLANQASAAQNAGRALAGWANQAENAVYRAEAMAKVNAKNAAFMAKGYTRGPDGAWIAPMPAAAAKGKGGGGHLDGGGGLALGGFLSYFTGWGKKLFETNLAFEKEFNNAKAVMAKSTPEQMKTLRGQILQMSKNSVFGPTALMKAAGELGAAGYEASDVMSVLPQAVQLAQGGRQPIDKMAEMLVNVKNQFRVSDAQRINDVLAETARQTMANFKDMPEAFKYAGPFAHMAGVDLETTAAMIGMLSQQGIKGSVAGTGLRRMETGFLKADKKSVGFLKSKGINPAEVYDKSGKMKDLVRTLELLEKKGVKASEAMKVFGERGGPILAALLQGGTAELKRLRDELYKSQGASEKLAAAQMEGLPGAWARFTAAIENARLKIGESGFTKDLENVTNYATRLTEAFSNAPQWMQRMVGGAGVLAGALAALAMPVALLAFSLRTLGLTSAFAAMAGMASAALRLAGSLRIITGLTGIGAALFIGYEIYENWDKLASAMERVKAAMSGLGKGDLTESKGILNDIAKFIAGDKAPEGQGGLGGYDWGLSGTIMDSIMKFFFGSAAKAEGVGGAGAAGAGGMSPLTVLARVEATFQPATVNVQGTVDASGLIRLQGQTQLNATGRGTAAPEVGGGRAAPSSLGNSSGE